MVDADHIVKLSHELFNSSLDANVAIVYDLCHVDLSSDGNSDISSIRRNLILMDGNRSIHSPNVSLGSKVTTRRANCKSPNYSALILSLTILPTECPQNDFK